MKKLLTATLVFFSLPLHAATYCPASSADLELALLQAAAQSLAQSGSISTINLRNDVDYVVDMPDQWSAHFDTLRLLGGFSQIGPAVLRPVLLTLPSLPRRRGPGDFEAPRSSHWIRACAGMTRASFAT